LTLVSEGVLPALLGLLNAFLILAIVVAILYFYRWLVIERKTKTHEPTPAPETGEKQVNEEKPRLKETITTHEVAAAVAAVKHHVKSKLGPGTGLPETFKPSSPWVLNWLNEVTQTLDHNPYTNLKTRE